MMGSSTRDGGHLLDRDAQRGGGGVGGAEAGGQQGLQHIRSRVGGHDDCGGDVRTLAFTG